MLGRAVLRTCPGCKLLLVSRPEEALSLLANEEPLPHVIVTDLEFQKGMAGQEFIIELRRRHPSVPVIVLSAHRDSERVLRAYEAGACAYFVKPATFDQLMRTISVIAVFLETAVLPD